MTFDRTEVEAQQLPPYLFHWTEASRVAEILPEGLRTSVGGFCGQHENEPAVNLTQDGWDPSVAWNENIFYLARPVRLTIDTSRLDPKLFGPDLNSMMEEGIDEHMADHELDVDDPAVHTWQMSAHFCGNVRYGAQISPEAIVDVKGFLAPRDWKSQDQDELDLIEDGHEAPAADWHVKAWPGSTLTSDLPPSLPPKLKALYEQAAAAKAAEGAADIER